MGKGKTDWAGQALMWERSRSLISNNNVSLDDFSNLPKLTQRGRHNNVGMASKPLLKTANTRVQ
jgi:hypothetical protein